MLAAAGVAVLLLLSGSQSIAASLDEKARNLTLQAAPAAIQKEKRLALVIGNSAYKDAPLSNPVNDARAMAKALHTSGFTVLLRTDVSHRELLEAVRDFGTRLRQGGAGVFYYAGHGMQIKGRNYLIPVGSDIQREDEVAYAGLDAQAVLDKMEAAGNGVNLMILDACRNNPFVRSFRSSTQGLAQMEAPVGTLVAFATAPGSIASDGQGANGLYTRHLLDAMSKPGSKVEDVFKQVRAAVRRDSQGKQVPWESTSLEGDFYFVSPPSPVAEPPPPDPAKALDSALWDAVRTSTQAIEVRAYLNRFPIGDHATQAHALLTKLEALQQPAANPATAPSSQGQTHAAPASPAPTSNEPTRPALAEPQEINGSHWTVELAMAARARVMNESEPAGTGQGLQEDLASAPLNRIPSQESNASAAGLPAAAATKLGPRVGDTWTYQRIDQWRRDSITTYTLAIDGIDSSGQLSLKGIEIQGDPIQRFYWMMLQPSAFGFTVGPQHGIWWAGMMPGETRHVTFKSGLRREDRSVVEADVSANVEHKGIERIQVSGGTFDALHLEVRGQLDYLGLSPAQTRRSFWSMGLWYVPDLHAYVARDVEIRSAGASSSQAKYRHELKGYTLAPR